MEFKTNNNYLLPKGLPFNPVYDIIKLQCYTVISILESSKKINKDESFKELSKDYEQTELIRLLLNLAIYSRTQLDNNNGADILCLKNSKTKVGTLKIAKKIKNLQFRNACNKIIHTEHCNFDLISPKNLKEHSGMQPRIYLYGKENGIDWKAVLNIKEFITVIISCIQ